MLKFSVISKLDMLKMNKLAEKQGKSACDNVAGNIYNESQSNCPIKTGQLKSSGYKIATKTGWDVGYSADYAEIVDKTPQKSLQSGKTHFISSTYKKYGKAVSDNEL